MSRPRLLTDPDEIAASDEFKRCLLGSKKKQEAVANEIGGVTQGTVWQWANRRLAIPASRAREAAAAVNADPSKISVAWRKLNVSEPVSGPVPTIPVRSQPAGFDTPTLITQAKTLVRFYLEERGEPAELVTDAILLGTAIDLIAEAGEAVTVANVIAFNRRFADKVTEVRNGDQRSAAAGVG